MKSPFMCVRTIALLLTLAQLYGCAAATVIRKQPDFEEENRQQLQQMFRETTGAFATATIEDAMQQTVLTDGRPAPVLHIVRSYGGL